MMVNGPLEIYGTVIGVKMFDAMFNILASMGIIFIPLLILMFQNITQPFESEIENGASTSLRRVGIHFLLWVFTVMLFVVPTWHLDLSAVTYRPSCAPGAVESRFGDTGTTYDDAFENLDYQDLRIPIMMGFVLSGMSGFTNAAITSLPCKTDVQAIKNTIDTTRLTPKLAQQVQRFQNECFAPARAKFDSTHPDPSTYKSTMDAYGGQSDLSWIGSHVFQSLYYADIYPTKPVVGFPYGEYPDQYQAYNSKQGIPAPEWGFPSCSDWWADPQNGIQQQIVNLVGKHSVTNPHLGSMPFTDKVTAWLTKAKRYTHLGNRVSADDVISRDMLYDVGSNSGFGRFYTGWMNDDSAPLGGGTSGTHSFVTNAAADMGQAVDTVGATIDRAEIAQEIPILQAVLLAFGLALGPMIIMAGMMTGQGASIIFSYYFLLGSLLFMTFIEKFVHYIEVSLHASQSYSVYAMGNSMIMYNVFTKLYFYAPMLYLMLMSIAGIGIGGSIGRAFDNRSSGSAKGHAMGLLSKAGALIK